MEKFIVLLVIAAVVSFLGAATWLTWFFVRNRNSKLAVKIMEQLVTLRIRVEKLLRWMLPPL